ncbi:porin [Aquincola sp. MAHUQ-54]|uniref:Porin n=1 Tax=Aquincola agrisoli TaxID=3119538 RepID=A0AAW9QJV1_9BURK
MKKSLVALAVLGGFAGMAAAQSSVTLFGVVDVAATYVKNDDAKQKKLTSGGNSTSRLGFRGVEDLGGGLKASFWLESHINVDDGTQNSSGKFWHRRSTVSLSGGFGEVRLGRDLLPTWTAFADYDPFGTVGVGDKGRLFNVYGGAATKNRADNIIAYFLPSTLGGIYGQLSVAAGEGNDANKYVGGRLGYKAGPFDVTAAYGQTELPADDYQVAVISGSYDFGMAKLMLSYQQTDYLSNKDKFLGVGVTAPVGPGTLKLAYNRTDGEANGAHGDADQFAIGYVYDLSKRTAIYSTLAYIKNKSGASRAGNYSVSDIAGRPMTAGEKSTGFDLGIRHSF